MNDSTHFPLKYTELSFLIDLLLNHKLPKATQLSIKDRINEIASIKEVHMAGFQEPALQFDPSAISTSQIRQVQSFKVKEIEENPVPADKIAQTPAAQAALAHRQSMINAALSRKTMPGSDSAPKAHGAPPSVK